MKKLLLLAALVASTGAYSRTLTPEEALQRAYADNAGRNLAPAAMRPVLMKTVKSQNGTPAVYLFSTGSDNWMALGASDAAAPVLGYGVNAADDAQMPPQMEWWLNEYSSRIQWADSIAALQADGAERIHVSKAPKKAGLATIEPLLTTTWNQEHPYNLYTLEVGGKHAPTGCVSTAMAQVMKYHEYPEAGHGIGTATTTTGMQNEISLNLPLDWANMRDNYWEGDDIFDASIDAVATLMQVVGYASGTNYGYGGSGASDMNAVRAMVDNFDYSPSTWIYYRDHYTLEDWERMLHEQLSEVGPVYYSGQARGGGHAFVCDGYEGGYFHINWGWGGHYDGMFLIDAFEPEGQGTGGYEGGYNSNQVAVFGMRRPAIDDLQPAPQLSQAAIISSSVANGNPSLSGLWYNQTYRAFTFTIGLQVTNAETNESDVYPFGKINIASNGGFGTLNTALTNYDIADGSYRISIVTCTEDHPEWMPVLAPVGMKTYGRFVKKNGIWVEDGDKPLQIVEASAPERLFEHQPSTYSITLKNLNDTPTSAEYGVFLVNRTDSELKLVGKTDSSRTYTLEPYSTETFESIFTFTVLGNGFEYDKPYTLVLADPKTLTIQHTFGTVTVSRPVLAQEVYLTPSEWSGEPGDKLQLELTFIPEDTSWKDVTWTSTDPYVASVDGNGLVEILHTGSCEITATTIDGSDRVARCSVTGVSSVETLIDGTIPTDIYGADGKLIMRQASAQDATALPAGLYILRQGTQTKTIVLTK